MASGKGVGDGVTRTHASARGNGERCPGILLKLNSQEGERAEWSGNSPESVLETSFKPDFKGQSHSSSHSPTHPSWLMPSPYPDLC